MSDYHSRVSAIEELMLNNQVLDENGVATLTKVIAQYMKYKQSNDIEVVLPFIINFVFDNGFKAGVQESVKILRSG